MTWPAGMPLLPVTQDVHMLPDGTVPSSYAVHLQLSVDALVYNGQTTLIKRAIVLTATDGVISGEVPHLNHALLSPTPVYFTVTEFANGQRVRPPWQLTPAADDVALDLDAEAPIAGDPGTPVAVGPAPDLTIGTVTTLAAGEDATAEITGTTPDLVLGFGIPQGPAGADGADGAPGADGADGADGYIATAAALDTEVTALAEDPTSDLGASLGGTYVAATEVRDIVVLTQTEYDNLAEYVTTTLYVIEEAL